MKRAPTKKLIASLCTIIDEIDFSAYSKNKAKDYTEYIKARYRDEQKLIDPVFFPKLAKQILGFTIGTTLIPKENVGGSADKPDFLPKDLNLHSFLFETKGTDCKTLAIHYPQLRGYIEQSSTAYGITLNLRDVQVFTNTSSEPISDLSFSIEQLYHNFKSNPKTIGSRGNTSKFLNFADKFAHQELDVKKKIKIIEESKPWTGEEVLSLEELTKNIREVVGIFHDDVRTQKVNLTDLLDYDNKRKEQIAWEIETIAESLDPKKPKREVSVSTLDEMLSAKAGSLDECAVDSYQYRVAYFTMTRILLVRLWEDIGFIDQSLYNGGFKRWYDNFERKIEDVLRHAFNMAGKRYSWLFNKENNYTWYHPSDSALVDVLYNFSHFNFSRLNADVLGTLYEEYVDTIDKKNKGQYYTPREVVSFIWDLVGFNTDNDFFRFEGGARKPKLIFDPSTGSGGFLVEAARRIREEACYNEKDPFDLAEIENAIIRGLYGSEIKAFPYYITEINLLIQLTPIIKKLLDVHKHGYKHREFALSIIHQDSLKLHNEVDQKRMGEESESFREHDQVYEQDRKHDIINLEGQKLDVYKAIKECKGFDYVCANPPYLGEKGRKELFRVTRERFPYWQTYYQGKMDYFYWFIILSLSKLREGGKLGFITTSYWPTADGATKLREFILDNAIIGTIIDFGKTKIFRGATGQHNMVFVLERCSNPKKRAANTNIKIVKVNKQFEGKDVSERLNQLLAHIKVKLRKKKYKDDYIEMFISPIKQGDLTAEAWSLMYSASEGKILKKIEHDTAPINDLCELDCGIFSNADYLSEKYLELIPQSKRIKYNINAGDGIYVLSDEEVKSLLSDDPDRKVIKRTYKNSDIDNYFIDTTSDIKYLLYIDNDFVPNKYPTIMKHLETFKEVLKARLDRYGEHYPWWRLHRPHEKAIYENPKIVTSRWDKQNHYALQEGNFFENSDINLYVPKRKTKGSLKYILGLMNSTLLNYWITFKGRGEGVSRQNRLKNIPIRRINFDDTGETKIHNHLVELVNKIIQRKKKLATFNRYFRIAHLTRLQDECQLLEINNEEIIKSLKHTRVRKIRTHNDITYAPRKIQEFYLKAIREEGRTLILKAKDKREIVLKAPKMFLDYLKVELPGYVGK
ncbi:MAG: N-6 DNA methylase [Planctomycetota bacterium]|jgi:type I restriction-modification system DNA methylase subunit